MLPASWQCWGEVPGDSWSSTRTSKPASHSSWLWLDGERETERERWIKVWKNDNRRNVETAQWPGLATTLKLSRLLLSLCSQEYGTVAVSYAHGFRLCFLHRMSYISAFSQPPLCWTGNEWDRTQSPQPPCRKLPIQECDLEHKERLSGTECEWGTWWT